jgi:hypothetical protein
MTHSLQFDHETAQDAVFLCVNCGKYIGFNKAITSSPRSDFIAGEWTHPDNPEQWMACE